MKSPNNERLIKPPTNEMFHRIEAFIVSKIIRATWKRNPKVVCKDCYHFKVKGDVAENSSSVLKDAREQLSPKGINTKTQLAACT